MLSFSPLNFGDATTMENNRQFLKKLKIEIQYDLAILLLRIYPKELRSGSKRDICTPMFS